ncbi:hypothetical protein D3C80_698890 [compost metagenome]
MPTSLRRALWHGHRHAVQRGLDVTFQENLDADLGVERHFHFEIVHLHAAAEIDVDAIHPHLPDNTACDNRIALIAAIEHAHAVLAQFAPRQDGVGIGEHGRKGIDGTVHTGLLHKFMRD